LDCADITVLVESAMFKGVIAVFTEVKFPYYVAFRNGVCDISIFV
jgi:hypothetical protein